MRDRGWGRVVNISTGYAHLAGEPPAAGAYGLANAALNALTLWVPTMLSQALTWCSSYWSPAL